MFQPDDVTNCKDLTEEDGLPYSYVPTNIPHLENGVVKSSPGLSYFHGVEDAEYIVQENGVLVQVDGQAEPSSEESICGSCRIKITLNAIESYIGDDNFDTDYLGELPNNNETFCRYSGGGDIIITNKLKPNDGTVSATIFGGVYAGCKHQVEKKTSKKDSFAQLQAVMKLCATKELVKKLKENPDEAKNVKKVVCYGLTLTKPIYLLRLTIDFEAERTSYELLSVFNGVYSFTFIDRAIKYITRKMSESQQWTEH